MAATITAEEIKEIRGMYGLTQKSFALLLGIGPASIVRYEQGSAPSKANANLIRAARHPEFMRECLERDGKLIPKKQRDEAARIAYAFIQLDAPEEENMEPQQATHKTKQQEPASTTSGTGRRTMDEVYHYTIQQEVLNEQAANLICDLIRYSINNKINTSDPAHPVSAMVAQLVAIKQFLITAEADDDAALEQIRGHLKYTKGIVGSMFSVEEVA